MKSKTTIRRMLKGAKEELGWLKSGKGWYKIYGNRMRYYHLRSKIQTIEIILGNDCDKTVHH